MDITDKKFLNFEKGGKVVHVVCDNDQPLGLLFDCLMEAKGWVIQRMTQTHKAEEAEAEEKMGDNSEPENQEENKEGVEDGSSS